MAEYKEPHLDKAGAKALYAALSADNGRVTKGTSRKSAPAKKPAGGSKGTAGKKSGK